MTKAQGIELAPDGEHVVLHLAGTGGASGHSLRFAANALGMQMMLRVLREAQAAPDAKIGTLAAPTQAMLDGFGAALAGQVKTFPASKTYAQLVAMEPAEPKTSRTLEDCGF